MILFPNIKINLGLRIISRRPDGYHNLVSVMIPVGWRDLLELTPGTGPTDTLTVSGRPVACESEQNLVFKALTALRQIASFGPVDIHLHKIIPDGAGLGGGSADAAFTLIGLNDMFGLGLSVDRLAEIAAGLGADCPFFIYNRPMLATGTGTELTPLPDNPVGGLTIAVVKPPVSVSTREAYAGVVPAPEQTPLLELLKAPIEQWRDLVINDFEQSVFAKAPICAEIKRLLYQEGALYASMSGSGSAVYGLYNLCGEESEADNLAVRLRELLPGCDILVCDC